jgi:hypothetical protein
MLPARMTYLAISWIVVTAPLLCAADLSSYREFKLGSALPAVAARTELRLSSAKAIHERPTLIQDLEWQPRRVQHPSPELESVDQITFSFYDGQLFRMLIHYDRYKTEGLTSDDMIDALSVHYGPASKPSVEIPFPSAYEEKVKVIARWEDAEYSFNLVRSAYQPNFALIAFSKPLADLAEVAIAKALTLEKEEAPQKEIERENTEAEHHRAEQEKARLANKPGFRP